MYVNTERLRSTETTLVLYMSALFLLSAVVFAFL